MGLLTSALYPEEVSTSKLASMQKYLPPYKSTFFFLISINKGNATSFKKIAFTTQNNVVLFCFQLIERLFCYLLLASVLDTPCLHI
jgi:hypothetical protein